MCSSDLDRLRFNWRGDEREYAILTRQGRLQLQIGDVRSGLQTLRQAITIFPDQADTKDIIAEMAAGFERFFVNGAALTVAPIISVGIFEEFRELTPSGARGDAIMNRLVDHMLTMDLLDRAADLLDHLVKHRFTGADKAAAGAKLALVRLLDGDSTRALTAIDDSSESGLSTELQSQRLRLAARALSGLGRPEDALQRISGDDSEEAGLLRVEILWRAKNWASAATALEKLVGAPAPAKEQASDEQSKRIVRWATAVALAGDEVGLKQIKDRFAASLDKGPYKAVFATITAIPGGSSTATEDIAARIAAATPMQSFLAAYRARSEPPKPAATPKG